MLPTVKTHKILEKSLENLSGDFFVSGGKTLLVIPEFAHQLDDGFVKLVNAVAKKLIALSQTVTIAGAGSWDWPTVNRRNARYDHFDAASVKIKSKDWFGRFRDDVAESVIKKFGLVSDVTDCDKIVFAGKLLPSTRFGINGLLSLVTGLLPTVTLANIYMQNVNGKMGRAILEIAVQKILPKTVFSFLQMQSGVISGNDIVAVESTALKTSNLPFQASKFTREAIRLNLGDVMLLGTDVKGDKLSNHPIMPGRKNSIPQIDMAKCNLCLDCSDVCPNGSIEQNGNIIQIQKSMCARCGACVDCCGQHALV
jgi:NAD-dependent dihydropyrimidine dehydrogenase PreA subunit